MINFLDLVVEEKNQGKMPTGKRSPRKNTS